MTSSDLIVAEMHVVQCSEAASEAYARAAACPWWRPLRRALLVRKARVHGREMDAWASVLLVEIAELRRLERQT